MAHAIIRGKNGRRHEVNFGDAPLDANPDKIGVMVMTPDR
jgi:hypothetical protein